MRRTPKLAICLLALASAGQGPEAEIRLQSVGFCLGLVRFVKRWTLFGQVLADRGIGTIFPASTFSRFPYPHPVLLLGTEGLPAGPASDTAAPPSAVLPAHGQRQQGIGLGAPPPPPQVWAARAPPLSSASRASASRIGAAGAQPGVGRAAPLAAAPRALRMSR